MLRLDHSTKIVDLYLERQILISSSKSCYLALCMQKASLHSPAEVSILKWQVNYIFHINYAEDIIQYLTLLSYYNLFTLCSVF